MSDAAVIDVRDVSKAYELYARPSDMLKELLLGGVRHDVFWALRNVSFSVRAGQRVGIIGPNGAGKSTLLQIIAGTLQPTSGTVHVDGTISALLSLVPAWNLSQTGLENIRFNLLLRGCTPAQIATLSEEIVDFAELGPFIAQPVRTYSSGMSARLSFAIATAIAPEVLIVDEVLGAGDGYFAAKAADRMRAMCDRGKALLFVSHSVAAVQQMCDTAIWMQNGMVRLSGEVGYVVRQYELDYRRVEDETTRAHNARAAQSLSVAASPDELGQEHTLRFRVVPQSNQRVSSTHFVTRIAVANRASGHTTVVPLETVGVPEGPASLDVEHSEWGRLHERRGQLSRILTRMHGRRAGGHFVINVPADMRSVEWDVDLDADADGTDELLALQVLNPASGEWQPVPASGGSADASGHYSFRLSLVLPSDGQLQDVRSRVEAEEGPAVRILETEVVAAGEATLAVVERQPFEIVVRVQFQRPVALADVGVKITRADGVYTFWQSSGINGCNLTQPSGVRTVRFAFDDNVLGAGEYSIGVYVSNGWNYPENYPYSEVFARTVGALQFRVLPELKDLDFGVVNMRVPVRVE